MHLCVPLSPSYFIFFLNFVFTLNTQEFFYIPVNLIALIPAETPRLANTLHSSPTCAMQRGLEGSLVPQQQQQQQKQQLFNPPLTSSSISSHSTAQHSRAADSPPELLFWEVSLTHTHTQKPIPECEDLGCLSLLGNRLGYEAGGMRPGCLPVETTAGLLQPTSVSAGITVHCLYSGHPSFLPI